MKERFLNTALIDNQEKKRFEIEIEGHFAYINYEKRGRQIVLIHTEADAELQGTGAASAVVEKTLHWIEDNGLSLLPFCPYVFAYLKRHPDWKRIVDPRFKLYDEL